MSELLGNSLAVFFGVTVMIEGGCRVAHGPSPWGAAGGRSGSFPYAFLLGLTDRFFIWGLFGGELLSLWGFVIDTCVILAIALAAFCITRVHRMVSQYPWLYERAGPFALRDRN